MYDFDRVRNVKRVDQATPAGFVYFAEEADVPEKLYRYTRYEYARDLLLAGKLRLGSLFSYKRQEQGLSLSDAQADEHEGTITIMGQRDGIPVGMPITTYNNWVLCLSEVCDIAFIERRDFGDADTIVEFDAKPFYRALARAIAPFCDASAFRKIQYLGVADLRMDSPFDSPENTPLAQIIKRDREDYVRQAEWRMSFDPRPQYSNQIRDAFHSSDDGLNIDFPVTIGFGVHPKALSLSMNGANPLQAKFIVAPSLCSHCRLVYGPDNLLT